MNDQSTTLKFMLVKREKQKLKENHTSSKGKSHFHFVTMNFYD